MLSVSANYCTTPILPRKTSQRQQLFSRSYPQDVVSFTSTNLLKKGSKEITKIVRESVANESNLIGQGCRGRVYDIPNTNYCVKLPIDMNLAEVPILDTKEWCLNISKTDKVNHIVAKLGDDISIMKKIKGEPCSIERVKEEVSDLPLESYKNLILQISNAKKRQLSFDPHSANVIYNDTNKSLTAIDFRGIPDSKTLYSPFLDTFICLSSAKNLENNARLGENLLGLAVEEISTGNKDKLPLIDLDLQMLCTNLEYNGYLSEKSKNYMTYIENHNRTNNRFWSLCNR